MTLDAEGLELEFSNRVYSLSARRLWEHTELGQINVFRKAISARVELNDATGFIDVVMWEGGDFRLTGSTLAELIVGQVAVDTDIRRDVVLAELEQSADAQSFIRSVKAHLALCANRRALRNQQPPFLPSAKHGDVFGVPHMFSTLQRRLQSRGKSRAGGTQWLKTIDNLRNKGVRIEEFDASNLALPLDALDQDDQKGKTVSAFELVDLCNFNELRFSVIPVVKDAQRPMHFGKPPDRKLKRTRNVPKAVAYLPRLLTNFDRILGYRIERVEHQSLWGTEHTWQAVTHEGKIIENHARVTGFRTAKEAANLATSHASEHFPKRVALGRWGEWAWTGGESYREWLITLPHYSANYLAGHFDVRNVLAHVRCDVREDGDGRRVLMLHEVQSDWAQRARRAISVGEMDEFDEERPPFLKEWPALTMKLILLHAAHQELDAVAWTRGAHQVTRYKGLGASGLIELYDRTLPREVNRMLKPFGGACGMLGVFVPTNFSIKQSENGYEVYSPERELLGIAPSLEDARAFVPDKGHELLYEVHGVRLPVAMRKAILASGFPAWG